MTEMSAPEPISIIYDHFNKNVKYIFNAASFSLHVESQFLKYAKYDSLSSESTITLHTVK